MQATMTISGHTFSTGDRVATPSGPGAIISIDPFVDEELLIQLDTRAFTWFSHRVVHLLPTAYADPTLIQAARAAYAAGVMTGGGWPCEEEADPELARFIGWLRTDYLSTIETRQSCAEPRLDAPQWLRDLEAHHA
jgi:hypothetical protein